VYRKQVRRRRAVLALLVIVAFALLTITYGEAPGGLQKGVSAVFGPLEEGADRALKPARDAVNWFDETFDARGENEELKEELAAAREDEAAFETAIGENEQLRKLLDIRESGVIPGGYEPVTGRVIARSESVWYTTLTIDIGTSSGVAISDPVVGPDGLVGRVKSATNGQAQIQLIIDPDSQVTAKIAENGAQGLVSPEVGETDDMVLDFIDSQKRIDRGDIVVTAGWRSLDGTLASKFPPNIPIGEVTEAPIAQQEASQEVHLEPYSDFADLDFVDVLTGGSR
jgi:rod shape-determining protein MreC